MSARDDLYLFAMVGKVQEDGNRAMTVRKLDAYRTEVLSEAAGILRDRAAQYPTRRIFAAGLRHGALALAKAAMGRGKSSRLAADATPECGGRS